MHDIFQIINSYDDKHVWISLKYNTALAPYKTEQPLQDIELQNEKKEKEENISEISFQTAKNRYKIYLQTLDLKQFQNKVL